MAANPTHPYVKDHRMTAPDASTPPPVDPTEGEVHDPHTLDESVELLHDAAESEHRVDAVAILDYGSQYSQLITRRVREIGVYGELISHDTPWEDIQRLNPNVFLTRPKSIADRKRCSARYCRQHRQDLRQVCCTTSRRIAVAWFD